MDSSVVKLSEIKQGLKILKPNYHLNFGKKRIAKMKLLGKEFSTLGLLTDTIYTGGIFKRIFVENPAFGIPYISGQHIRDANPVDSSKLISKKFTPRQEDMTLHEGQILVSCAGTVGNVRLIGHELDGIIGSQDIIRVIPDNSKAHYGYIYAYLASPTAYNYIQSFIYGSVVPRIDPNTLAKLPVPMLPESRQTLIHNLIVEAMDLREKSLLNLTEAHSIFYKYLYFNGKPKNNSSISANTIRTKFQKRLDSKYYIDNGYYESQLKALGINLLKLGDLVKTPMNTAMRGKRIYVNKNGIKFLSTSELSQQNNLLIEKYLSRKTVGIDSLIVRENLILLPVPDKIFWGHVS